MKLRLIAEIETDRSIVDEDEFKGRIQYDLQRTILRNMAHVTNNELNVKIKIDWQNE